MQIDNAPIKSATAFAQAGTKNTIPEASQVNIKPGAASFTDGFPALTMTPLAAGGVPPSGQDVNGILHFLSDAVRWNQIGAGYPFDATFATAIGGYPKGAVVRSHDGLNLWVSQIDHNNTDPNAGLSNHWQMISTKVHSHTWTEITDKPDNIVTGAQYTSSLGTNGWMKRPDGIIEQWGQFYSATTLEIHKHINFNIAFPNSVLNVLVSDLVVNHPESLLYDTFTQIVSSSILNTGFDVNIQWSGGGVSNWYGCSWRAIGN